MTRPKPTNQTENSPTIGAVCGAFEHVGMAPAEFVDVGAAHDFAERLIGGKIATPEALWRVHKRSGAGLFVLHEHGALTGVVALIPLSERGLKALWRERFDAVDPNVRHVARRDEAPAAVYAWGIAASNHEAAKQMMQGLGAMVSGAIPHLAFFGRVATEAGRRLVVDRIGFRPVPGSTSGLMWIEPFNQRTPAAAA